MRFAIHLLVAALVLPIGYSQAPDSKPSPEFKDYTHFGEPMPLFTIEDTKGKRIDLRDLKGKVVFVNFWATWCGPCQAEMPRLEKDIWRKYKSDKFVMIGIAREQSVQEITKFCAQKGYTYPIAADPHRETYKRFADAGIPRNYVVGPDGTILFQSLGYDPQEFDRMKQVIEGALAKLGNHGPSAQR